jgi:HD superfamily phosphodiesterase
MPLLSILYNYVITTVSKYNIDESHGLSHSMNILTYANKIYNEEIIKQSSIKQHEKIIYIAAILHDMCDKKYMDQNAGINDINNFIESLKDDDNVSIVTTVEQKIIIDIISTISYSYVKINGFPDHGEYQTAYNIVREADLLCAYDFDRCMIYQMYTQNYSLDNAYKDATQLFNVRMFTHMSDGLLFTQYAKNNHERLVQNARSQILQWDNLIGKQL